MSLQKVLESVQTLSIQEQLALIEATSHMIQAAIAPDEAKTAHLREATAVYQPTHTLHKQIEALRQAPNPAPEKMIRFGMFADNIPDLTLEDFKIAEWHPADEEWDE